MIYFYLDVQTAWPIAFALQLVATSSFNCMLDSFFNSGCFTISYTILVFSLLLFHAATSPTHLGRSPWVVPSHIGPCELAIPIRHTLLNNIWSTCIVDNRMVSRWISCKFCNDLDPAILLHPLPMLTNQAATLPWINFQGNGLYFCIFFRSEFFSGCRGPKYLLVRKASKDYHEENFSY